MAEEPDDDYDYENDDDYVKAQLMEGGASVGKNVTNSMIKFIWIGWFVFLALYFLV